MSKNMEKGGTAPIKDKILRGMRNKASYLKQDVKEEARDVAAGVRHLRSNLKHFEKARKRKDFVATKPDQEIVDTITLLVKQLDKHVTDLRKFADLLFNKETKRYASVEDIQKAKHLDASWTFVTRLDRHYRKLSESRDKAVAAFHKKKEVAAQKKLKESLAKKVADKIGDKIRDELTAPGRMEQSEIPSGS